MSQQHSHKHAHVYTKSGSIYFLCFNKNEWFRVEHKPENDRCDGFEMCGTFPTDWEPVIGQQMRLFRPQGRVGDKYDPDMITTSPVIKIIAV